MKYAIGQEVTWRGARFKITDIFVAPERTYYSGVFLPANKWARTIFAGGIFEEDFNAE